MEKLRIGIVGAGLITTVKHLPSIKKLQHKCSLVALCDINKEVLIKLKNEYSINNIYTDVNQMLSNENIDIVHINTPPSTHKEIAQLCLEKKVNVLMEKPMATNYQDCLDLIEVASNNGVKIMVGHSELFYPPILRMKKTIADGLLGEVRGMNIFRSTPKSYMTSVKNHWANKLPGGVIGETGPHLVYLSLEFIGQPIEVYSLGRKIITDYSWTPYDDYRIILQGDKVTSSISSIYTSDHWGAQLIVWGDDGLIICDFQTMNFKFQKRPKLSNKFNLGYDEIISGMNTIYSVIKTGVNTKFRRYKNTHEYLIEGFVDSVIKGTSPPITGEDGAKTVQVLEKIVKSLETNLSERI